MLHSKQQTDDLLFAAQQVLYSLIELYELKQPPAAGNRVKMRADYVYLYTTLYV